jgi:hypothetical protein
VLKTGFVSFVRLTANWANHSNHALALHTRLSGSILTPFASMGKVWDGRKAQPAPVVDEKPAMLPMFTSDALEGR